MMLRLIRTATSRYGDDELPNLEKKKPIVFSKVFKDSVKDPKTMSLKTLKPCR